MPVVKAKNKFIGFLGEDYASKLLKHKGFKILENNFTTPVGEIDIVARDEDKLIFVEVKTRKGEKYGLPEEAITKRKLEHIVNSARFYIKSKKPKYKKATIIVVALTVTGNTVKRCKLITVDEI